jgi:hypothetical protein
MVVHHRVRYKVEGEEAGWVILCVCVCVTVCALLLLCVCLCVKHVNEFAG